MILHSTLMTTSDKCSIESLKEQYGSVWNGLRVFISSRSANGHH